MKCNSNRAISTGSTIIKDAIELDLDPSLLYESVIDLSGEGVLTASAINIAAGLLLNDLGLPNYFFKNITSDSLKSILRSIAGSIKIENGKARLVGEVALVDFDLQQGEHSVQVRIATEETRDEMEQLIGASISGHRREFYFCPSSKYYTYIIRSEIASGNFSDEDCDTSKDRFTGEFVHAPKSTLQRYSTFLKEKTKSVLPLIKIFNLPETGEVRIMFDSNFALPQLTVLRKIFAEHNLTLVRGYWEPYIAETISPSSICSLYVSNELSSDQEVLLINDLNAYLAFSISDVRHLYVNDTLTFNEMLFAGNLISFTHYFIYKERLNSIDREIMNALTNVDQHDLFRSRIHNSNKSEFVFELINEVITESPDLVKFLYNLFKLKFHPDNKKKMKNSEIEKQYIEFEKMISIRFIDDEKKKDIFDFAFNFISCCLKTNFYKKRKRSYAFRFDNNILDPVIFDQFVFGVFYVNGHYACGTHLRAADISRGGLRMIRVTPSNYHSELDKAVLLNYALGPKAQRLKHKDICESGSKGVVVPKPIYAKNSKAFLNDYTDGIMDLMLGDSSIVDYLGIKEKIFFGPDEGTALLMDDVALHAKERGYKYWRTITTGKSFGIPHDTYGILENGDIFGLIDNGDQGVELQINGKSNIITNDMEEIYKKIGGNIVNSGMTTTCVMSAFRAMIGHYGEKEESLNLMMTGGPDGDLGANEIQCYKGKICLLIDGGSILFDPNGLDKKELMKIAFKRNSSPRANSLDFPVKKLSKDGFMVPRMGKKIKLPDGTIIADGAMFHRSFITDKANRKYIKAANIRAFIPCGGFKDTINYSNVSQFIDNFSELKFIVEGANVFFDDAARRFIATTCGIKQIKDSTANKGGVFSSSIAEVLTAFLFKDDYDEKLLNNIENRWALIKEIMELIETYAAIETQMLLKIHDSTNSPLFELSVSTSESILALQDVLYSKLPAILKDDVLVWKVMESYIPAILINTLGKKNILSTLNSNDISPYRDAIITKKLASLAFYKRGLDWDKLLKELDKNLLKTLKTILG